jgi:CheY-like chemotaxis protein
MKPRVLVVDDEPKLVENVSGYLEAAGFEVVAAGTGEEALDRFAASRPDLVLLDLRLPGIHGLEVARQLREDFRVPIIMLTAQSEDVDRIVGLEVGADDYVTKPFNPRELVARVRAVLRRSNVGIDAGPTRVFVSSVIDGFQEERRAVQEAVSALSDSHPVRATLAEDLPAGPAAPRDATLRAVEESDIYLGIYGLRYGYVDPETGVSATEAEYRTARELGRPVLVFIQNPGDGDEREPRQEAFVGDVMDYGGGHYVAFFDNADQLRYEAYRSLERLIAETRS